MDPQQKNLHKKVKITQSKKSESSVTHYSEELIERSDQCATPFQDIPVNRILPEIWETIAEKIDSSKDLVNLSQALPICEQVFYRRRVEWLFYQVLPVLINNLSGTLMVPYRQDLLKYRLVCKHWKFGVDNLFENSTLHYPATGDNVEWKLNRCHYEETGYFEEKFIRTLKIRNLRKMLDKAAIYPNIPTVKRHINVVVPRKANEVDLMERFFVLSGHHIYFLKLILNSESPVASLKMLTRILPNLPNLKGLGIEKCYDSVAVPQSTVNDIKRELHKIRKDIISADIFRSRVPLIETLNLNITGLCGDILSQNILSMFCRDSLKSFKAVSFPTTDQIKIKIPNLLHLSLKVGTNKQLKSVLAFNCPLVRKLELHLNFLEVDYDLLCKVLQKFQDRLSHLTLNPTHWNPNMSESSIVVKGMADFFTTADNFKMPEIKSLTLLVKCPLSFNFICGDGFKSLEYLNLYLDDYYEKVPDTQNPEVVDLIEKIARVCPPWMNQDWDLDPRPDIQNSNIWSIFPRLKCLTIPCYGGCKTDGANGWTYRRNQVA